MVKIERIDPFPDVTLKIRASIIAWKNTAMALGQVEDQYVSDTHELIVAIRKEIDGRP